MPEGGTNNIGGVSFKIAVKLREAQVSRLDELAAALGKVSQQSAALSQSLGPLTSIWQQLAVAMQGVRSAFRGIGSATQQQTNATRQQAAEMRAATQLAAAQAAQQQQAAKAAVLAQNIATQAAKAQAAAQAQAARAATQAVSQQAAAQMAATRQARATASAQKQASQQIVAAANKKKEALNEATSALQAMQYAIAALGLNWLRQKLSDAAQEATLLAARVENLQTVVERVAANVGYGAGAIANFEFRLRSLGITTQAARQSMTLFARNNLDLAKASTVARIAQDAAVIAGENSSEAFEKLTIAVQRLDTRLLRNRGILINLRNLYQRVARETGRVETTLTAAEKQQMLMNEVIRTGASIMGTYEAALNDVYKQWTSMVRYSEEAQRKFGEGFIPMFEIYVKALTGFYKWFEEASPATRAFANAMTALGITVAATTTLILGYKVAIMALAYAFSAAAVSIKAVGLAMLASPWFWVVGAIGLVVSAFVGLKAAAKNAAMEHEDMLRRIGAAASRMVNLNTAVRQVEYLGSELEYLEESNLATANAHLRLETAIEDMLIPLEKEAYAIRKLYAETGNWKDALEEVRKIRPEAFKSPEKVIEGMRRDLDAMSNFRRKLEEKPYHEMIRGRDLGKSDWEALATAVKVLSGEVHNLGDDASDELKKASKEAENYYHNLQTSHLSAVAGWLRSNVKLAEQVALQKQINTEEEQRGERLRAINRYLEQQDVALQLAHRIMSQLAQAESRLVDDPFLEIVEDMKGLQKDLQAVWIEPQRLIQAAADQWHQTIAESDKTFDEAIKNTEDEEEIEELRDKKVKARQAQEKMLLDDLYAKLQAQVEITNQYNTILRLTKLRLEMEERDLRFTREKLNLMSRLPGFDTEGKNVGVAASRAVIQEATDHELALLEIRQKHTGAIEGHRKAIDKYTRSLEGNKEAADALKGTYKLLEAEVTVAEEKQARATEALESFREEHAFELAEPEEDWDVALKRQFEYLDKEAKAAIATTQLARRGVLGLGQAMEDLLIGARGQLKNVREELERLNAKWIKTPEQSRRIRELENNARRLADQIENEERAIEDSRTRILQIEEQHVADMTKTWESFYEKQHDREQELLQERESNIDYLMEQEKKLTEEIRDLQRDQTAYTAEEARKRLEERRKEFETVNDFIRQQRLDLLQEEFPGIGDVSKVFEDFSEQVMQATHPLQLDWLVALGGRKLNNVLRELFADLQKVNEEMAKASEPAEKMKLWQQQMELMQRIANVREFAQRAEQDLTDLAEERRGQLGGIAAEREREIDLVEDALTEKRLELEAAQQLLDVMGRNNTQEERKLALLQEQNDTYDERLRQAREFQDISRVQLDRLWQELVLSRQKVLADQKALLIKRQAAWEAAKPGEKEAAQNLVNQAKMGVESARTAVQMTGFSILDFIQRNYGERIAAATTVSRERVTPGLEGGLAFLKDTLGEIPFKPDKETQDDLRAIGQGAVAAGIGANRAANAVERAVGIVPRGQPRPAAAGAPQKPPVPPKLGMVGRAEGEGLKPVAPGGEVPPVAMSALQFPTLQALIAAEGMFTPMQYQQQLKKFGGELPFFEERAFGMQRRAGLPGKGAAQQIGIQRQAALAGLRSQLFDPAIERKARFNFPSNPQMQQRYAAELRQGITQQFRQRQGGLGRSREERKALYQEEKARRRQAFLARQAGIMPWMQQLPGLGPHPNIPAGAQEGLLQKPMDAQQRAAEEVKRASQVQRDAVDKVVAIMENLLGAGEAWLAGGKVLFAFADQNTSRAETMRESFESMV